MPALDDEEAAERASIRAYENGGAAFAEIDGHCAGFTSVERICPSSDATCGGWDYDIVGQGGAGDSLVACQARCAEASCGGIYFDDAHGCGNYDACVDSGDGENWGASYSIRVSQSFAARAVATTAFAAMSVFAIDVDGDGDVDALSASWSDDIPNFGFFYGPVGEGRRRTNLCTLSHTRPRRTSGCVEH